MLLDYFQEIKQSGRTLLALLNNLLDLAKLESGKLSFEFLPTDLGTLIDEVLHELKALADQREISIDVIKPDSRIELELDAVKIKQVVRNLLSNAVKLSPDCEAVELAMNRRNKSVTVTVRDHGPGVPEGELETVFDKFVQSSKTTTGAGGTGLGLAICREIIAAHHGRIWAENHPKEGAVFSFEVPFSPQRDAQSQPGLDKEEPLQLTAVSSDPE